MSPTNCCVHLQGLSGPGARAAMVRPVHGRIRCLSLVCAVWITCAMVATGQRSKFERFDVPKFERAENSSLKTAVFSGGVASCKAMRVKIPEGNTIELSVIPREVFACSDDHPCSFDNTTLIGACSEDQLLWAVFREGDNHNQPSWLRVSTVTDNTAFASWADIFCTAHGEGSTAYVPGVNEDVCPDPYAITDEHVNLTRASIDDTNATCPRLLQEGYFVPITQPITVSACQEYQALVILYHSCPVPPIIVINDTNVPMGSVSYQIISITSMGQWECDPEWKYIFDAVGWSVAAVAVLLVAVIGLLVGLPTMARYTFLLPATLAKERDPDPGTHKYVNTFEEPPQKRRARRTNWLFLSRKKLVYALTNVAGPEGRSRLLIIFALSTSALFVFGLVMKPKPTLPYDRSFSDWVLNSTPASGASAQLIKYVEVLGVSLLIGLLTCFTLIFNFNNPGTDLYGVQLGISWTAAVLLNVVMVMYFVHIVWVYPYWNKPGAFWFLFIVNALCLLGMDVHMLILSLSGRRVSNPLAALFQSMSATGAALLPAAAAKLVGKEQHLVSNVDATATGDAHMLVDQDIRDDAEAAVHDQDEERKQATIRKRIRERKRRARDPGPGFFKQMVADARVGLRLYADGGAGVKYPSWLLAAVLVAFVLVIFNYISVFYTTGWLRDCVADPLDCFNTKVATHLQMASQNELSCAATVASVRTQLDAEAFDQVGSFNESLTLAFENYEEEVVGNDTWLEAKRVGLLESGVPASTTDQMVSLLNETRAEMAEQLMDALESNVRSFSQQYMRRLAKAYTALTNVREFINSTTEVEPHVLQYREQVINNFPITNAVGFTLALLVAFSSLITTLVTFKRSLMEFRLCRLLAVCRGREPADLALDPVRCRRKDRTYPSQAVFMFGILLSVSVIQLYVVGTLLTVTITTISTQWFWTWLIPRIWLYIVAIVAVLLFNMLVVTQYFGNLICTEQNRIRRPAAMLVYFFVFSLTFLILGVLYALIRVILLLLTTLLSINRLDVTLFTYFQELDKPHVSFLAAIKLTDCMQKFGAPWYTPGPCGRARQRWMRLHRAVQYFDTDELEWLLTGVEVHDAEAQAQLDLLMRAASAERGSVRRAGQT